MKKRFLGIPIWLLIMLIVACGVGIAAFLLQVESTVNLTAQDLPGLTVENLTCVVTGEGTCGTCDLSGVTVTVGCTGLDDDSSIAIRAELTATENDLYVNPVDPSPLPAGVSDISHSRAKNFVFGFSTMSPMVSTILVADLNPSQVVDEFVLQWQMSETVWP